MVLTDRLSGICWQNMAVHPKFVKIILFLLDDMIGQFICRNYPLEPFVITNSVSNKDVFLLQFCLTFFFFTCILSRVIQNIHEGVYIRYYLDGLLSHIRHLNAKSKCLHKLVQEAIFADDCALLAHTNKDLQLDMFTVTCQQTRKD